MMSDDVNVLEERAQGQCDDAGVSYFLLWRSVEDRELKSLPRRLVDTLIHKLWQKWRWAGSDFDAPSIEAYITRHPPKGLGTDIALFRRLIEHDRLALSLLDQALQRPVGPHVPDDLYNIQVRAPTGTSLDATIRRLRKDRPDLHERWVKGELSANKAAIEAGWRKRLSPLEQVLKLLSKLTPRQWQQVKTKEDRRRRGSG